MFLDVFLNSKNSKNTKNIKFKTQDVLENSEISENFNNFFETQKSSNFFDFCSCAFKYSNYIDNFIDNILENKICAVSLDLLFFKDIIDNKNYKESEKVLNSYMELYSNNTLKIDFLKDCNMLFYYNIYKDNQTLQMLKDEEISLINLIFLKNNVKIVLQEDKIIANENTFNNNFFKKYFKIKNTPEIENYILDNISEILNIFKEFKEF